MSRAFVKESDSDDGYDAMPELPISEYTNYVTAAGLQQLRDREAALLSRKSELDRADGNKPSAMALAQLKRELRYVVARLDSAIVVDASDQNPEVVGFGATVTALDDDYNEYAFHIVGEDEADFDCGKISWVSPLARSLTGTRIGDRVRWKRPIGDLDIEVDQIFYD